MIDLVAVPAVEGVERATRCGRCERLVLGQNESVGRITAAKESLPPGDFCRWCARPTSERAERLADNVGFIRFAQMVLGAREPAIPTGRA